MMTRRPASASSAAAVSPARPAPTTMASASTPSPGKCWIRGRMLGRFRARIQRAGYMALAILSHKAVLIVEPKLVTVAAMVAPIPAAISAYSIAVVPLSSARKRRVRCPKQRSNSIVISLAPCCASGSEQRRQVRHQRYVRRRHRVLTQPVRPHPGKSLAFFRGHRSVPSPAHIKRHDEVKIRIGVAREGERREACLLDDDTQLLLKL